MRDLPRPHAAASQGTGVGLESTAAGDCGIDSNLDGAVDGLADTSGGACTNCTGTDTNPNDYKRVVVLVRWNRGLGTRYALQSTTIPNPGMSAAPAVQQLTPTSVTTASATLVNFTATISFTARHGARGTSTAPRRARATGSLTTGTSAGTSARSRRARPTPNVGEVLDGTYLVSAKGFDAYGQAGSAKYSTVTSTAARPTRPSNPHAGRNDGNAYLEWGANAERDVEGYRVFRVQAGSDQDVCGLVTRRDALQGERDAVGRAAVLRAGGGPRLGGQPARRRPERRS